MRKIVVAAFVSLDGVMQAPGGPEEDTSGGFAHGGWTHPFFTEETGAEMGVLFAERFDLLLGRRTYDIFAAHWPKANDDIAALFNGATKWVATHRPEGLAWQNTEALGADVVGKLRALKQTDGPTLLTQGSSELVKLLVANDLVDEMNLITFPVLLGKGKRLFADAAAPAGFELARSKVASNGVIVARYRRAGAVKTGSFAL